jgi:hypothetical protein
MASVKIALLAIVLGGLAGSVEAADQPSRHVLSYRNDRLSVQLVGVPVTEIVAEIGRASGAEVSGTVRQPGDVTAEFDDVPLQEALHRLLGEQNFVLKYGKDDRLRTIKLLGGPTLPVAAVAPPAETAPAPDQTAILRAAREASGTIGMLDAQPPVPVSSALAQALGSETATPRQLFDLASNNDDAAVRAEAARTFIGAMDAAPDFRDAVLGTLNTLDDATVTELLRGLAGTHAEEIAAQFAAGAHAGEMSSRAFGIYLLLGGTRATATGTDTRPAS